ncbi:MAG TPA: CYTH domain-containing protein [Flavobacteriaceae bacterium]|nr:CYTH domain-containing protein [Flavobacteriaceae bacterium]
MAYEIERKFLVTNTDFIKEASSKEYIVQSFLNRNPDRTVRIRIKDDKAFITVKGVSNAEGTTRREWEYAIPVSDAKEMLKICEEGAIEKWRYLIPVGNHIFEVDIFEGENEGLIVAEVELGSETESFQKPAWLGEEVTGNLSYYNSNLSQHPFTKW